jgi:hypothetical protein
MTVVNVFRRMVSYSIASRATEIEVHCQMIEFECQTEYTGGVVGEVMYV